VVANAQIDVGSMSNIPVTVPGIRRPARMEAPNWKSALVISAAAIAAISQLASSQSPSKLPPATITETNTNAILFAYAEASIVPEIDSNLEGGLGPPARHSA